MKNSTLKTAAKGAPMQKNYAGSPFKQDKNNDIQPGDKSAKKHDITYGGIGNSEAFFPNRRENVNKKLDARTLVYNNVFVKDKKTGLKDAIVSKPATSKLVITKEGNYNSRTISKSQKNKAQAKVNELNKKIDTTTNQGNTILNHMRKFMPNKAQRTKSKGTLRSND